MKIITDENLTDAEISELELELLLQKEHGTIKARNMARNIKINDAIDNLGNVDVRDFWKVTQTILKRIHNKD